MLHLCAGPKNWAGHENDSAKSHAVAQKKGHEMTRHTTTPLPVPRTRRNHPIRNMTSLPAGKIVPIAAVPLLREDSLTGTFGFVFEMQETVEVLMNGIDVVVEAWVVPKLAYPEFRTMDDIDLAYTGNKRPDTDEVVKYFDVRPAPAVADNHIHMRLGKHRRAGRPMNMDYVKSYNTLVNFQRREVSPHIEQRELDDFTLAQALWPRNHFSHIVPDFDQAVMEGEIALNVSEQNLALKGTIGDRYVPIAGDGTGVKTRTAAGAQPITIGNGGMAGFMYSNNTPAAAVTGLDGLRADLQGATALLAANGIKITLQNLHLAQQARIFANIRKRYNGLSEEMFTKLLMDGINITEQQWRQPYKAMEGRTRFGMTKRYSGDADALTASVVNGAAAIEFKVQVPRMGPGGMLMIVAYIAPEQLFERQQDPYLVAQSHEDLPAYLADHLDPEAVEIVPNSYIDEDHDEPDDIYGYAPTNHQWNTAAPGIGGRFHRPEVDAGFDEDRNALWAVETQNPTLTKDAYLVPADIHLKPFWTSTIDPFDSVTVGQVTIEGNTQFGALLIEALPKSDYDAILEQVDQDRIVKEEVPN